MSQNANAQLAPNKPPAGENNKAVLMRVGAGAFGCMSDVKKSSSPSTPAANANSTPAAAPDRA
jgi:hypothetical protein